ncbi:MAG: DNA translocase FtsK 4TM domain-containing protein, partial [Candidatus Omnitrophica bacterium]|nr:DNA translocase FtsK 4TM domain-containing protein [Candidatus Omnitrophota bacterium]
MSRKLAKRKQPAREPFPIEQFWGSLEEQRRREVLGVLFTAASLTVFLALISYPIGDSDSWRTLITDTTSNLIGTPGNLIAWTLFFLTGLCAYLIPPMLVLCAWGILFQRDDNRNRLTPFLPALRFMGCLILLACCCALVSITLHGSAKASWIAGGLMGSWLARVMLIFGKVGAYLVLTTTGVLTLLLTTNFLISDLYTFFVGRYRAVKDWWRNLPWEAQFREVVDEAVAEEEEVAEEEDWDEEELYPIAGIPALGLDDRDEGFPVIEVEDEYEEEEFDEDEEEDLDLTDYEDEEDEEVTPSARGLKVYTPDDYAHSSIEDPRKDSRRKTTTTTFSGDDQHYELPGMDLLEPPIQNYKGPSKEELANNKRILERTLAEFNIKVEVVAAHCGPVVTRYDLRPAPGVKVRGITTLQDDLALALEAHAVRIIAPVPGKNVVGIEIPNKHRQDVYLSEVICSEAYRSLDSRLAFALGKTISGEPFAADLSKMPHLLIAGATGTGKSVGVNSLICSILFNSTPKEVRFLMVDPKRVELSLYQDIPHLLSPVVTDPHCASAALSWAVDEMEKRYMFLEKAGVRDLKEYNAKMKKWSERSLEEGDYEEITLPGFLPYVVIIIDELADLMMTAPRDVEEAIVRITQKARAAGIHLVLATQRPS